MITDLHWPALHIPLPVDIPLLVGKRAPKSRKSMPITAVCSQLNRGVRSSLFMKQGA